MRGRLLATLGLLPALVSAQGGVLEHRLWLLAEAPPTQGVLSQLSQAGVDALVIPLGEASLIGEQASLRVVPPGEAQALRAFPLWGLLWVNGEGKGKALAESLWLQLGPYLRGLPFSCKGLVLASRQWWEGLVPLASQLQRHAGLPVELAAPLEPMVRGLPPELPKALVLVPLALGNLAALGLPAPTPQDAAALLEELDERGVAWRGGVVVATRVEPPWPGGENPWTLLLRADVDFKPTAAGDLFVPRQGQGKGFTVVAADGARLERDLGILLRPMRRNLRGWDSVGWPPPAPAVGLSWEGFLAFFSGVPARPKVVVRGEWVASASLKVTVENQAPFASAFATTGNVVDLTFSGTEVRDVVLLAASGADFGRLEGGFTRTARAAATTVRLYLRAFPPQVPVEAAVVQFISRPRHLAFSFSARLGDGSEFSSERPTPLSVP